MIGVDDSLDNLNAIAAGGGTNRALLIRRTDDPSKLTEDFVNALAVIREAALGCEYPLPVPPSGEKLDTKRVNVQYTVGGYFRTLRYIADCANGEEWHYDNPSAPTKIILCKSSCDELLSDASAKINIVFGCLTVGTVN